MEKLVVDPVSNFCVLIPSHISNMKRIEYLIECIESLLRQTVNIPIYLSISFQDEESKYQCLHDPVFMGLSQKITILIQEKKTSQMRHIYLLYQEVVKRTAIFGDGSSIPFSGPWIMFSDDDDSYLPTRVEQFIKNILAVQHQCFGTPNIIAGCYESTLGKNHRERRHEYWCYCVHIDMVRRFYEKLEEYPDIIDNKCCDVLFAEYLRRSGPEFIFCYFQETLYNYRIEDNGDSITGFIKENQERYTRQLETPTITSMDFAEYVVDWNECLYENREVYLHDIFLRTIVGCNLDYILQAEFRSDCTLFSYVDATHLEIMKEKHEYWRSICNTLFDIPFT